MSRGEGNPFRPAEEMLEKKGVVPSRNGKAGDGGRKAKPAAPEPPTPPAGFDPKAVVERIQLFWLKGKDTYLRPAPGGVEWLLEPRYSVSRVLRIAGVHSSKNPDCTYSQADQVFQHVHDYCHVPFAGPVAGRKAGVFPLRDGRRIIVTSSYPFIEPVAGDCPLHRAFVDALLVTAEEDQTRWVFAWLKTARAALRAGVARPGPWLVLAGPPNCGKTFLQQAVLTPMIGRAADPREWMLEKTQHNAEVIGAEHLTMDELPAKLDYESRMLLGERMKSVAVNSQQRWRGMHQDGFLVPVFWRASLSINDAPERLKSLPPLSSDVGNKLLLLWCQKKPMPMPTTTDVEWQAFGDALAAELPAFAHFIDHEFEIPPEMRGTKDADRYGFDIFHHPALTSTLFEQENESGFQYMLDGFLFGGTGIRECDGQSYSDPWGWEGAEVLGELLKGCDRTAQQARAMLKFSNASGTYLARLADRSPERFVRKRATGGRHVWMIHPPKV